MQTIAKNRREAILAKMTSAKAFTLDNCFRGEEIRDLDAFRRFLNLGRYTVKFDKTTGKGNIYLHSNANYDFEAAL